jgi:hypothetical protein
VNVPVNPAGRCGAPETEPGPWGAGDEFTGISFTSGTSPTIAPRAGASRQ